MASLGALRKQAKEAGIAAAVIRSASTAEELQSILDDHAAPAAKRAVKKAHPVKKTAVKKTAAKKNTAKANSKSAPAKSKPAAKKSATTGKAKRTTAGTNGYVPKGGRNLLDGVDFTNDEGWNARDGSAPDRIVKALRKAKGNRERVFEALKGEIWEFVGKKNAKGEKRTKSDAEAMLRYRIARTAWDFAMRTGQHEKASNRVEYGTGGTGQGVFKPKTRKAAPARKSSTAKSGAKKSTAKKTTARKSGAKKRSTAKKR